MLICQRADFRFRTFVGRVKVTLKKDEIEQQIASLVSVMPEKLLDTLTKQEIAELFAFMESEPK